MPKRYIQPVRLFIVSSSLLLSVFFKPACAQLLPKLNTDSIIDNYGGDKTMMKGFTRYDISHVLMPQGNTSPLGYLGPRYYCFRISFTDITRSAPGSNVYIVKGNTIKWDTVKRNFEGYIILTKSDTNSPATPVGMDSIKEGNMQGIYFLYEEKQKLENSGSLEGTFSSDWYTTKSGHLHYDDLLIGSDDYKNNQFSGTWREYKTDKELYCNWGDFRIPDSDSLDGGDAQFTPAAAYVKNGWNALGYGDTPGQKSKATPAKK